MPFCLSSGDTGLIDLPVTPRDDVEDLAGDVAFEGADSIEFGVPSSDPLCDVGLRRRIGSKPADGDDMQGAVGGAIATSVEPMPDCLSGRSRNGTDPAEGGEARLRSQSLRIVAGR